jgi:L-ribulose-5-phosphate 3-epimerase
MQKLDHIALGIYEKAFPSVMTWRERLVAAGEAGFDFLELSIDESDSRLEVLDWDARQRANLRETISSTGVPIITMCLSAQRRFPMGSSSPEIRRKSIEISRKAIDLACDLGIRILLIPGYEVYSESGDASTGARFLDGLSQIVGWASRTGVMLAIENTEKSLTSITQTLWYVNQLNSPWLQLYGDIGNLNAMGHDVVAELLAGAGHLAGLHVKDTLAGQFRNVPFGSGSVQFVQAFRTLWQIHFSGPILLEMWGGDEDGEHVIQKITEARQRLEAHLLESWSEPGETVSAAGLSHKSN